LLDAAAGFIAPGGMLVYAVCSLEPEEGPAVVEAALSKGDWSRAPLKPAEMGGLKDLITPEGDLRTLPSRMAELGGMDGFYAARLVRR
jgi:16S rRNA (cytosine967-C5)-methyltransferase